MIYPNLNPKLWSEFGRKSFGKQFSLLLRERRYRRRAVSAKDVELRLIKPALNLPRDADVILIAAIKNGMATLPSFFNHYRKLGVEHFAVVDDRSEDGSREYLETQSDITLFTSNVDFRRADGGLLWRDMLVNRFGQGRWFVSVDCDEYLIFPGCEKRPLQDFLADLERIGQLRALAPMIDLYPEGPIGTIKAPIDLAIPPTEVCPLFDGSDYSIADEKFCTSIRGGPRNRVFHIPMRMTKFPVVFADRALAFSGGSHHGPLPLARNFIPPDAVLLHHKFAPGSVEAFQKIAEHGTHFNGSKFYKEILDSGDFSPDTDFRYEETLRFHSSEDLVARGFMRDLRSIDQANKQAAAKKRRQTELPYSVPVSGGSD